VATNDPFWMRRLEAIGALSVADQDDWREYQLDAAQLAFRRRVTAQERVHRAARLRRRA
jgi:hypothetical protein